MNLFFQQGSCGEELLSRKIPRMCVCVGGGQNVYFLYFVYHSLHPVPSIPPHNSTIDIEKYKTIEYLNNFAC